MGTKTVLISVLAAVLLVSAGCSKRQKYGKYTEEQMQQIQFANRYDLPEPSGQSMALGVFSDTITSDEILAITERILKTPAGSMSRTEFTEKARPYVREGIKGKITDILLYQEARKTASDQIDEQLDKAVDTEINKFVASYGNNYALAESKISEMGYDWRTFREYQKKLLLTRSYLSNELKDEKRFSQQQFQDYYDEHRDEYFCSDGKLGFSLIEIRPELLGPDQINEGETSQAAAERIGRQLAAQLSSNIIDFTEAAKNWHGDLAPGGGIVLPFIPKTNALPEPYNSLEAYAIELQPGQNTGPIKVQDRVFIVQLNLYEESGCKSFYQVQHLIEQQLIFLNQQEQYRELVDKLVMKTDLAQMERFTEFCTKQAYNRWGRDS